jgi:hypothetical protein
MYEVTYPSNRAIGDIYFGDNPSNGASSDPDNDSRSRSGRSTPSDIGTQPVEEQVEYYRYKAKAERK